MCRYCWTPDQYREALSQRMSRLSKSVRNRHRFTSETARAAAHRRHQLRRDRERGLDLAEVRSELAVVTTEGERVAVADLNRPLAEGASVVCPGCGGPTIPLGQLGGLAWSRCRDCGFDSSQPVEIDGAVEVQEDLWRDEGREG